MPGRSTRGIALFTLALLLAVLAIALRQPGPRPPAPAAKDRPGEAADFFLAQRTSDAQLPLAAYGRALARRDAMAKANARVAKLGASAWRAAGPGIGGRTRALLVDPRAPDTLYAGSVSGGVWKSTNGGARWEPSGQLAMANLAVASLAMDPADSQVLFAGTGEGVYVGRPVSRSRGVRGDGVFVTRDGARTWRRLAATRNPDFHWVNRLVFDGERRLHAATQAGLFVSADAGATWRAGLPPGERGCADLVHVPPTRMIATCGVHAQSTMYVSDDGGASWSARALPVNAGRTSLAVAPSNPQVVYALSAHRQDYGLLALQRSDDGGSTWRTVLDRGNADALSSRILSNAWAETDEQCRFLPVTGTGQGWFDNVVAVDPRDPSIVYAGGVDLFRSDDGGRTFRILSRWWPDPSRADYVHADQHAIVFDPRFDGSSNRRLFAANDGGIAATADARGATTTDVCGSGGTPAWSALNAGYQSTQFYDGALSADGSLAIGGLQDNGTQLGRSDPSGWREVFGGDGGVAAIDPRDARRYYVSTPYGYINRTDDDGATFVEARTGLPTSILGYLFIAPFILDPNDPDVLWTGSGTRVYRSANRGTTWQPTSPAIAGASGVPSALAVLQGDSRRVSVAFDSGQVASSADGGATWTLAQPRAGFVSSLTFAADDAQRLYATVATFGGAHVYVSTNGGASFTAIDGASASHALPDVPAHTLLVDPRDPARLWLGTDIGLFTSPDRGARWYADASGLGNVLIERLLVGGTGAQAELVAFTYGHGVHRASLAALASPAFNPGYSGSWFDAAVPGQGMLFEAIPQVGELAVGWYTYLPDGSGRAWLVGNGPVVGTRATVLLYVVRSGRFAGAQVDTPVLAGEVTIDFADCTHASATYSAITLDATPRSGTIALQRLTSSRECEAFRALGDGALGDLAVDGAAGDIEYGHGGLWSDPAAQWQGFVLDVDASARTVFGGWYTYDPLVPRGAGQAPTWFTVQGTMSGRVAQLTVYETSGGRFTTQPSTSTVAVGTLRLSANGCGALDAQYALQRTGDAPRTGTFALARVAAASVCDAMAP